MTLVAEHGWRNDPVPSFQWTTVSAPMGQALREALEPYSGYPWLHHGANGPVTWSMRPIDAAGVQWHVLTTGRPAGSLEDGRPLRVVRHLVLQGPSTMLPGRHLSLDAAGPRSGDATPGVDADDYHSVDWAPCGGNWSSVFAKRINEGLAVWAILPSTATAMDWWLSIEAHLDPTLWHRTILLELLPDDTGANVVLAVEGTPCAEALRTSGRALLDLARTPAAPPDDARLVPMGEPDAVSDRGARQIPEVQLTPGGPPVGLAALIALALILIAGVIAATLWALDTGSVT